MRPLIKGFCARSFMKGRIDLTFISETAGALASIAKPLAWEEIPDDVMASTSMPPTLSLRPDEAQHLMDELWRCGIRPTEGQGSAGALAATQDHLKDLQRVAFALLRDEQAVADTMRERGVSVREVRA